MSEDGGTVQKDGQVPEGQTQGQENQGGSQSQESLTLEKVQQMIADATEKAVEQAREQGRRELQSQQDRNKAELAKAQREARIAATTLEATNKGLEGLDPEVARNIELARLKAEKLAREQEDQTSTTAAQTEAHNAALTESLNSHLNALGIKTDDPRVDWAKDAPDYLTGRNRFDASVANILKEDREKETTGLTTRLKEIETALNQLRGEDNVERNSAETGTPSGGGVTQGDADFVTKFGAGDLPYTKENVDRYNKILANS